MVAVNDDGLRFDWFALERELGTTSEASGTC